MISEFIYDICVCFCRFIHFVSLSFSGLYEPDATKILPLRELIDQFVSSRCSSCSSSTRKRLHLLRRSSEATHESFKQLYGEHNMTTQIKFLMISSLTCLLEHEKFLKIHPFPWHISKCHSIGGCQTKLTASFT